MNPALAKIFGNRFVKNVVLSRIWVVGREKERKIGDVTILANEFRQGATMTIKHLAKIHDVLGYKVKIYNKETK